MHWTNEHYVFLQGIYKGPLVRLTQEEFLHAVHANTREKCSHCHSETVGSVLVPVKRGDQRFDRGEMKEGLNHGRQP